MANAGKKAAFLLGRTILGGYFIYTGLNHFKQHRQLVEFSRSKKVLLPHVAVPVTGAMLVGGGASLLLGLKPRTGALAIIGFLAAVTPWTSDFWNEQDANQKQNSIAHFGKNVALLGATLALAGAETWPLSVAAAEGKDRETKRRRGMVRRAA